MPEPTPATSARAMLERLLPMFLATDLNGFADLFAEDGVHELPFAPPGVPRTIVGRENIRAYVTAISNPAPLTHTDFANVRIHDTADPEVAIAEYDAEGHVTATGERYSLPYVNVVRVRDGRILQWRDYWSPVEPFRLLGRLPSLVEAAERPAGAQSH